MMLIDSTTCTLPAMTTPMVAAPGDGASMAMRMATVKEMMR